MNNQRRKQINEIIEKLGEVMDAIETLKDAEEECYDNLPENIQCGKQGDAMQEVIDSLEYASSDISDAIDYLNSAIE